MNKFTSSLILVVGAMGATLSTPSTPSPPEDNCCLVKSKSSETSLVEHGHKFCIETTGVVGVQSPLDLNLNGNPYVSSVACGSHVEAKLCPKGTVYGPIIGQAMAQYSCESPNEDEVGISIGADEIVQRSLGKKSSIILNSHPWVAKGPNYISLNRE